MAGVVERSNNWDLNRPGIGALTDKTHSIQFELTPENSRRAMPTDKSFLTATLNLAPERRNSVLSVTLRL